MRSTSSGPRRQLGECVNWTSASTGRKRQLGRGVKWANASTGQARQVGREGVYDQSKRELISFLEKFHREGIVYQIERRGDALPEA